MVRSIWPVGSFTCKMLKRSHFVYKQGYKKWVFQYLWLGDGLNKLILPFKQNQVDRYEWCDWHVSIHCFDWKSFDSVFSQFLVYSTMLAVSNVLVTCWLTVDGQVTVSWKWGLLFTITQWLDQCWITFVMVRAKFLLTLQGL